MLFTRLIQTLRQCANSEVIFDKFKYIKRQLWWWWWWWWW